MDNGNVSSSCPLLAPVICSLPSLSLIKMPYKKMATLEEKVLRNQDP